MIARNTSNSSRSKLPSEDREQAWLVSDWRQSRSERIFHIPNGGKRGKFEAQRMKVSGVSPGVPDLHIPGLALWIEMKRQKGGSVEPDQKDWHKYLRSIGHTVMVCRGYADAVRQLSDMGISLSGKYIPRS